MKRLEQSASRVLVTGANGLIGRALVAGLLRRRTTVTAAVRREAAFPPGVSVVRFGDLGPETDWREALAGCDVVVHLAARVHVMRDDVADPLTAYRGVNVAGTLALARQAAAAGAKRFIFVSSVKVNGEGTQPGRPFRETDVPAPVDPYGVSKLEAEQALLALAASTGIEVVVIRSPLVYGPGVRANFAALMRAVARGVPLPLGAVNNRRSLVAIDNLVDLIDTCVEHPAAANEIFFVSDGEDLSTPELVRRLAHAMGRPARLFPMPASVLMAGAMLLGKREVAQRLLGSLQVDISKARSLLGWTPPVNVDEGLRRAVQGLGAKAT